MTDPTEWGKYGWKFLHAITEGYSVSPTFDEKQSARNLVNSLPYLLPCNKCKINFKDHLSKRPLTDEILNTRSSFKKWMIDIHNDVNRSLGKRVYSYDEVANPGYNLKIPLTICLIVLFLIIYALIVIKFQ